MLLRLLCIHVWLFSSLYDFFCCLLRNIYYLRMFVWKGLRISSELYSPYKVAEYSNFEIQQLQFAFKTFQMYTKSYKFIRPQTFLQHKVNFHFNSFQLVTTSQPQTDLFVLTKKNSTNSIYRKQKDMRP